MARDEAIALILEPHLDAPFPAPVRDPRDGLHIRRPVVGVVDVGGWPRRDLGCHPAEQKTDVKRIPKTCDWNLQQHPRVFVLSVFIVGKWGGEGSHASMLCQHWPLNELVFLTRLFPLAAGQYAGLGSVSYNSSSWPRFGVLEGRLDSFRLCLGLVLVSLGFGGRCWFRVDVGFLESSCRLALGPFRVGLVWG